MYWEYDGMTKPQNILQSTVGFEALMHLLSDILQRDNILTFSVDVFIPYIIKTKSIEFANIEMFPIATRGKKVLYDALKNAVFSE